jgi:hypothetical protein
MLHCIKIKEKICALHDEKKATPLDKPVMAIWRMASAHNASIERSHRSGFPLGPIQG